MLMESRSSFGSSYFLCAHILGCPASWGVVAVIAAPKASVLRCFALLWVCLPTSIAAIKWAVKVFYCAVFAR